MKCKHCGKKVDRLGPETWHVGSGMIRCDMLQRESDIYPPKAEA